MTEQEIGQILRAIGRLEGQLAGVKEEQRKVAAVIERNHNVSERSRSDLSNEIEALERVQVLAEGAAKQRALTTGQLYRAIGVTGTLATIASIAVEQLLR